MTGQIIWQMLWLMQYLQGSGNPQALRQAGTASTADDAGLQLMYALLSATWSFTTVQSTLKYSPGLVPYLGIDVHQAVIGGTQAKNHCGQG